MKTFNAIATIWLGALLLAMPIQSWAGEQGEAVTAAAAAPADATTPAAQPAAVTAAPATTVAVVPKKDEELKLEDFCRRGTDSLDGALTCAEKLEDIAYKLEQADEKSDDKGARNLERILKRAKSKIKSSITKAFASATDAESLSEVKEKVSEIISVLEGTDSDMDKDLKDLSDRLGKLAQQNIDAEKQVKYFDRVLRPAYNDAMNRYMDALNSGDPNRIAQAEQAIKKLDNYANQSMNLLKSQDPTTTISMLETRYPDMAADFEHYLSRHQDLEMAMQNNMSAFTTQAERLKSAANQNNQNTDGTSQTLPHAGEPRQIRGSGFPAQMGLPTYGSVADFYGNSNLTTSFDPLNNNSNISNSFRPDLSSGSRVSRGGASIGPF